MNLLQGSVHFQSVLNQYSLTELALFLKAFFFGKSNFLFCSNSNDSFVYYEVNFLQYCFESHNLKYIQ